MFGNVPQPVTPVQGGSIFNTPAPSAPFGGAPTAAFGAGGAGFG